MKIISKKFKKDYYAIKSAALEINESQNLSLTYKENKEEILSLIKLTKHKDGSFSYKIKDIIPPAPKESLKILFKRPKDDKSITGIIWKLADKFDDRKKVIEEGLKLGLKRSTLSQQFYQWNNRYPES